MVAPVALDIEVVSDVVCPWCYLGKRRLQRALSMLPDIEATVRWRPFRLDPSIPEGGISRREYVERKFGSMAALEEAHARLAADGREEGIEFRFDRITRSPSTTDAHRLVHFAAETSVANEAVEALFAAYFTDGVDVGDRDALAAIAGRIGLDAAAVAVRLASGESRAEVDAEIEEAYRIGVTGVPCFILGRRYAVMGAQPAAGLAEAIAEVARLSGGPMPAID